MWGEGGGGDYTREAIIFNISIKRGRLFEGRLLFKEIQYFCCDYSKEIKIVKCSSSAFNIAVQSFCLFVFSFRVKKVIDISLLGTLHLHCNFDKIMGGIGGLICMQIIHLQL